MGVPGALPHEFQHQVAAAQVCSSALTYLLWTAFATSLWLACLSPSTTDLDINVSTLKTWNASILNDSQRLTLNCAAGRFYGSTSQLEKPILARQRHLDTVSWEERDEVARPGVARAKHQGVQARRLQKTILVHMTDHFIGTALRPSKRRRLLRKLIGYDTRGLRKIKLGRPKFITALRHPEAAT